MWNSTGHAMKPVQPRERDDVVCMRETMFLCAHAETNVSLFRQRKLQAVRAWQPAQPRGGDPLQGRDLRLRQWPVSSVSSFSSDMNAGEKSTKIHRHLSMLCSLNYKHSSKGNKEKEDNIFLPLKVKLLAYNWFSTEVGVHFELPI